MNVLIFFQNINSEQSEHLFKLIHKLNLIGPVNRT